jgi:hypothetical protein
MYVCVRISGHVCMYVCIYTHINTHTYVHTYIYTQTQTHTFDTDTDTDTETCMRVPDVLQSETDRQTISTADTYQCPLIRPIYYNQTNTHTHTKSHEHDSADGAAATR